jgi:hypothetical protein
MRNSYTLRVADARHARQTIERAFDLDHGRRFAPAPEATGL